MDAPLPRWSGIVLLILALAIVAVIEYSCLQQTGAWCDAPVRE